AIGVYPDVYRDPDRLEWARSACSCAEELVAQPGLLEAIEKPLAVCRIDEDRVVRDMRAGKIGLQLERTRQRHFRLVDLSHLAERHRHQSPRSCMMGMHRNGGATDIDPFRVSFEREQRHVTHRRRIEREKRITRTELMRLLKRF